MMRWLLFVLISLCSINTQAQSNNFNWIRTQTGTGTELTRDIVLSSDHFVYAIGSFNSPTLTLGTTTLTNGGGFDIFLAKYDTVGNLLWAKRYGGSGNDYGIYITADSLGSVYFTGTSATPVSFGATSLATAGTYIAKLTAAGTEAWAVTAASNVTNMDIASDPAGNTVICGRFMDSAKVGTANLLSAAGKLNGYVAQFSSNGTFNWYKRFYSTTNDLCEAITVASNGKIAVGGQTYSSTKVYVGNASAIDSIQCTYNPSSMLYSRVGAGAFVCSLQPNGSFIWGKENFSDSEWRTYAYMTSASANANGEFYFTFVRNYTGSSGSFSTAQAYVLKFGTDGTKLWAAHLAGLPFNISIYGSREIWPTLAVKNDRIFATGRAYIYNPNDNGNNNYFVKAYYDNGDTIWTTPTSPTMQVNSLCASGSSVFAGGGYYDGFVAGLPNINAVNVAPLIINAAASDKTACTGGNIALAPGMSVNGGAFPYTYQWTPTTDLSNANVANPMASTATVGTTQYTVTITDALGTIKRDTMVLTVLPQLTKPTISLLNGNGAGQPDTLVCSTPNSGNVVRYLWGNAAVSYNTLGYEPKFTIGTTASRYWVSAYRQDAPSCQSPVSDIFYYKTVKANAGRDTTVCAGQSISLGGTPPHFGTPVGNVSYNWFSPTAGYAGASLASPYISIQPTVTADYILVVTDQSGQTKINDTVKITVNPMPNLGADTAIALLCANETTNLLSLYNTTGFTSAWNMPSPALAPPGNYRLIASSGPGCVDTVNVNIVLDVAHWTGAQSGDWHTAANWSNNKVPAAFTHVIINSGTPNNCTIGTANGIAASLQLRNGATLHLANGMTINVMGNCAVLPQ